MDVLSLSTFFQIVMLISLEFLFSCEEIARTAKVLYRNKKIGTQNAFRFLCKACYDEAYVMKIIFSYSW